jgi:acyl dehydratase
MKHGDRKGSSGWKKAGVALKNVFSNNLSRDLLGYEEQGAPFEIVPGLALAYALATSDKAPAYFEKDRPLVSPLYASAIFKDVVESIILHPKLGMNVLKMVHAEQTFEFFQPIYADMKLLPSATVAGIRDVSTGQILDVDAQLAQDGETVAQGRVAMFVRGKPGKKAGEKSKERKTTSGPEMAELTRFSIGKDQPKRYAHASGDYNPIHTNRTVARLAGFKAPIAHGLCVLACSAAKLTEAFAEQDPTRLRELKCRFAKPVYPGQELTLNTAQSGDGYLFSLVNARGKPVLSNGFVRFS